jgi:signal transduction histidine kinase
LALLLAASFTLVKAQPSDGRETKAPHFEVRHFDGTDGLPAETINALAQTPDGYLWIGTYRGLARFDGHRMATFDRTTEPELPSERVIGLHVDKLGRLWVATEPGIVYRMTDGRFVVVRDPGNRPSAKLMGINGDEFERVWVVDRDGTLTRVEDGHTVAGPRREPVERGPTVFARAPDTGHLYLLHFGVVALIKGDRWVEVTAPNGVSAPAQMIGPTHDRGVWAAYQPKVHRLVESDWADETRPLPALAAVSCTGLRERSDGVLVYATAHAGILLLGKAGETQHFGARNFLKDNWVRCTLLDQEGTLWAGTSVAGLGSIHTTTFDRVAVPVDWDPRPLKTVTPRRAGGVWAGSEGDGLYSFDGKNWRRFGAAEGLGNSYVWSVLEDDDGKVWTGTWGGGLFRFDGVRFTRVPGFEDATASIGSIAAARDGGKWIGTAHGLWRATPDGRAERYGTDHGLGQADVRALAEGPTGDLWFGLADGSLGQLREGRVQLQRNPLGRTGRPITALNVDERGVVWVGTLNDGLFRMHEGSVFHFGADHGVRPGLVHHIAAEAESGTLWLGTHLGLVRISRADLDAYAEGKGRSGRAELISLGGTADRAARAAGSQPSACRTADGVFWFPTSRGLLRADSSVIAPPDLTKPVIESVSVDGRKAVFGSNVRTVVPAGSERVEISFTAPSFREPDQLHFRYRLNRAAWIEGGSSRSANYHRLPPGEHRFEVAVENRQQTAATHVLFTVEPFFWQRGWVQFCGYAFAVGAIVGGVRLHAQRAHRIRTEELRRIQAIERERTRIARDIHDDLGSCITRISLLTVAAQREPHQATGAVQRLNHIHETALTITRKLDEIVWAVSPRHDTIESVSHYLCGFAEENLGSAGISCRFDLPRTYPVRPVFAEARHHVFLTFQEAIHNVIKHSRATRVVVTLRLAEDAFEVVVEDNGVGFSTSPVVPKLGGNGLGNMRRRLAEIGGSCRHESVDGGGTRVCLNVPFAQPASGVS